MLLNQVEGINQKNINASVNIVSAYDSHVSAPHRHFQKSYYPTYHCILRTISGAGKITFTDGSFMELNKREVLISKFANIRMFSCDEGEWHYHIIWFQSNGISFTLNNKITLENEDEEQEELFFSEILTLLNNNTTFDVFLANCKLLNRIADYLLLINKQYAPYTFHSRAEEIIYYIDDNIHTELQLKDIAEKFNYCEKQLRTIILKKTGLLPKKYILATKLKKASELLVSTAYTVEYIAYSLGFSSTSHFMNAFKKMYNITPIEYRRRNQKKIMH